MVSRDGYRLRDAFDTDNYLAETGLHGQTSPIDMKQTTRDNLIYLAVGFGIVALVVADFWYADSHGKQMWMPSEFAFTTVMTTWLIPYFVYKYLRKMKTAAPKIIACVLLVAILHVILLVSFRDEVRRMGGAAICSAAILELAMFLVLSDRVTRLLSRTERKESRFNTE